MHSFSVIALLLAIGPAATHAYSISTSSSSSRSTAAHTTTTRNAFCSQSIAAAATALVFATPPPAAHARGRATLEQSYDRYAPRIRAGGTFYNKDLKELVVAADWVGVQNALQEPPRRTKADLQKADAGVAERARQAGGFSDARVLVAADLFAASFSENSFSAKTKKMQASVNKLRGILVELQSVAKQATGDEASGGMLFGLGAKKPDKAALSKRAKELYVEGGNTWNEYIMAANDELALKFDRFEYVR